MKCLNLLFSLVMICTLQWGTHLIVKADVPKDIYFPKNSNGVSLDDGNRQLFNNPAYSVYCELTRKNMRYRVKYVLENKITYQKCNLDRKYLNNGYFKNVSVRNDDENTLPFGNISEYESFEGSHRKNYGPYAIFRTKNCSFVRFTREIYIYKI
ncbi:hypothetical protein LY90DRAFT_519627 [Neocallimastix californiae]|uniref:Uncharacterized protein n=1 Tax=Neocallimastix californiae TaxID=1754190 RepID=A0A1Y1YXB2_9FUNG|nr:hypothetical protein LY90DRAFT_519627 [Neocallimastix californiae]|eukprot:ORY02688.1 hypothetical protein LY90DRAFT_519627 [Neocallimastix californiae]